MMTLPGEFTDEFVEFLNAGTPPLASSTGWSFAPIIHMARSVRPGESPGLAAHHEGGRETGRRILAVGGVRAARGPHPDRRRRGDTRGGNGGIR